MIDQVQKLTDVTYVATRLISGVPDRLYDWVIQQEIGTAFWPTEVDVIDSFYLEEVDNWMRFNLMPALDQSMFGDLTVSDHTDPPPRT